ncbi:hypothetical protein H310_13331 [Aphanomyces invadans]|uniref:Uncharacterized protein n=1 Tax=Aphanomyces invadans TaxID=157072 RepID=A0A024TFV6_9STRA|nr:hypothetical protein H310_13331 [Aphanomyces invadans]ETV92466.1 hypothetical protein H310_13331 [Aphanomyces invadans]|eukprot:XP_008879017.1 hypothetical protein H310_13331 [Aphanomyces invadans]
MWNAWVMHVAGQTLTACDMVVCKWLVWVIPCAIARVLQNAACDKLPLALEVHFLFELVNNCLRPRCGLGRHDKIIKLLANHFRFAINCAKEETRVVLACHETKGDHDFLAAQTWISGGKSAWTKGLFASH